MKATTLFKADGSVILVFESGNSADFESVSQAVNFCKDNDIKAAFTEP